MKKILISAPAHPVLSATFIAAGYDVVEAPSISYEELEVVIPGLAGLVVTTRLLIDKELLSKAENLKWIGRLGSGMEKIDVGYASEKNILSLSTPEGNCTAVGEHTLMLLLCCKRHLLRAATEVKNGIWMRTENRGTEIKGKKIGIIGYGHTGSAFANAVSGLGADVMAYDKYKTGFNADILREVTLQEIQETADVISFHLPLAAETKYFFNANFAEKLKNSPLILNTSRGAILNQQDLLVALDAGRISGAGLDVLENEKPGFMSSADAEVFRRLTVELRILITPHIAGYTFESLYKMSACLLEKLGMKPVL